MGSVIDSIKTKEKCQIFTPDDIVKKMLDHLGYINNLYGKTILESSCGNGQFLKEIVRRYIKDCIQNGLSMTEIRAGLSRDIFGIELDRVQYYECLEALNAITDSYNIKRVCWKIKNADALRDPYLCTFDFVIGNPPYVSYWDLDKSEREFIEEKYSTCRFGAWDYSYAFLQDGFNHLNSSGQMVYIIPNSMFKTKSGRAIRNLLRPYLMEVLDFTTTNVFEKVLTSPAIIVIKRNIQNAQINYRDLSKASTIAVPRSNLDNEWLFECQKQMEKAKFRFGDFFRISTSVATQCNKAFVLTNGCIIGNYYVLGENNIEKDAIRMAASPRGQANDSTEYIIFPYYYLNGELKHYEENEYQKKFPNAYNYLKGKKDLLDHRDSDQSAHWFEYGRSQALMHINQSKILLSTIITGKVRAYVLNDFIVPYSGLFITAIDRSDALPLSKAMDILVSNEFMQYLEPRGVNARGKSIRITAKNIADFCW